MASFAAGFALVVCIMARLPHRLLAASGVSGWALAAVVVIAVVNGARAIARAPFSLAHSLHGRADRAAARRDWAVTEVKILIVTIVVATALTLPLYALLRATPAWWLLAWVMFALVTIGWQLAAPLAMRARSGRLTEAPVPLTERVRALGAQAGVDLGRGVLVAGKAGSRGCNAYVAGLGPTRQIILETAIASWPPELIDQVVAHEIGHWRLGHSARRLPLTLAAQLVTLAAAASVLSQASLLRWAGVASAGDPRSYPLLLLLTVGLALPARCLLAWRDRAQERAADRFALDLLGAPDDFATMLEKAASDGDAPRRLRWWHHLTASHPPIDERTVACTRFASAV